MVVTRRCHVTAHLDDDEDDALISLSDDSITLRTQHRSASTLSPVLDDTQCDVSDVQCLLTPDLHNDPDSSCSDELDRGNTSFQQDLQSNLEARESRGCEQHNNELWTTRQRWFWMFALFASCGVAFAVQSAMSVTAMSIEIANNWTTTDTGLVLSSFFVGTTLTQVLGGYVSDRFGGELSMTAAMAVWAALTGVTPLFVNGPWSSSGKKFAFVAIRFLTGCVQGFHFPALNAILSKRIPSRHRAFSFCFIMSGTNFGILLTGLVGSVMLEHLGWQYVFYSLGIAGLTWTVFALATTSMVKASADTSHESGYDAIVVNNNVTIGEQSEVLVRSNKKAEFSVPWLTLFRRLPFWAVLVAHFCGRWTFFILLSWLPIYFQEKCPTQETISFGGSGLFVLVMPFVYDNYVATLVCSSMAITFCSFHRSGVVVNVQDIAPKYAGSVFGLMNSVGSVPGFVGVYVAGFLHQTFGNWSAVLISTAINCVVGGVFFLALASGTAIV